MTYYRRKDVKNNAVCHVAGFSAGKRCGFQLAVSLNVILVEARACSV